MTDNTMSDPMEREPVVGHAAADVVSRPRPNRPQLIGTAVFIAGLVLSAVVVGGDAASQVAHQAAIGVGISLAALLFIEIRRSSESLLRPDVVGLAALYYLLFSEFLVSQPMFDQIARAEDAKAAVLAVLAGFGGIAVGRHWVDRRVAHFRVLEAPLGPRTFLRMYWICFAVAYFHMLLSVRFNVFAMINYFMAPRFSAPWTRGRFGDLSALLYEVGAVIYLVPPIAGLILGRRRGYSVASRVLVLLALLFTLFYGFTSGTRSTVGVFLVTFLVAYYYSTRSRRQILWLGALVILAVIASTIYGVQFRNVGLREYLAHGDPRAELSSRGVFFVDYNLATITGLVRLFPDTYPYLGIDVPAWVVVRIVPRALWPGKPDGTLIAPETYLTSGRDEVTISATFIGEAYMAGGILAVVAAGLLVGFLASWWTQKAFSTRSDLGILLYGSGFFAVVSTMRSMYMLPVAVLPTIAAAVLARVVRSRETRATALSSVT